MTELADRLVESAARRHLSELAEALDTFEDAAEIAMSWGRELAGVLLGGGRLLVVGNGGSAAQAQHLSAEVVGRYRDDRPPFSAIALHTEPSALTAIVNDYGIAEMFARQVGAHGRRGDVCVLMSTSGGSRNVIVAAERASRLGLRTWAMTGPVPNPLAAVCDQTLSVDSASTAAIQELHLVGLHLLCESMDLELARLGTSVVPVPRRPRDVS